MTIGVVLRTIGDSTTVVRASLRGPEWADLVHLHRKTSAESASKYYRFAHASAFTHEQKTLPLEQFSKLS